MQRYEIIIYWSNEDEIFIAEVPELPGCMAHGDSEESALQNIKKPFNYGLIQPGNSAIRFRSLKDVASCMHEDDEFAETSARP